jgi:rubrerythrin
MEMEGDRMAIHSISLKELEVYEENGSFKERYINEKKIPAMLTNYSLKMGKDTGLTKGSLLSDVIKLQAVQEIEENPEKAAEALTYLDEIECLKVIYLACAGLNKSFDMSFDSFVANYHEDTQTTLQMYATLIKDLVQKDPNQFAKGLKDSTKKKKKKGNPKHQNYKSKQ